MLDGRGDVGRGRDKVSKMEEGEENWRSPGSVQSSCVNKMCGIEHCQSGAACISCGVCIDHMTSAIYRL